MQQIQQTNVDGMNVTGAVISENVVDLSQGVRLIAAFVKVTRVEGFMGMGVVEAKASVGGTHLPNGRFNGHGA
jgi:hypothetical protein